MGYASVSGYPSRLVASNTMLSGPEAHTCAVPNSDLRAFASIFAKPEDAKVIALVTAQRDALDDGRGECAQE